MSDPTVTTVWARAFLDELARSGVVHVCVAPGSRSTPLVMAVANDGRFTAWVQVDERSAGFFALGVGKATGRPAAVITTSGTAAANLYPAVIEASLATVPLLVLTADRPLRLRGSDANQTINQEGLFGGYPRESFDAGDPTAEGLGDLRGLARRAVDKALGPWAGPVHVNLPFDKPLEPVDVDQESLEGIQDEGASSLDDPSVGASIETREAVRLAPDPDQVTILVDFLSGGSKGLIVAGPNPDAQGVGPALVRLADVTGFPLLADPLSGARFGEHVGRETISRSDLFLRDPGVRERLRPDHILRVGGPPTSAGVLGFLEECRAVPQVVVTAGRAHTNSLSDNSRHVTCDVAAMLSELQARLPQAEGSIQWTEVWHRIDQKAAHAVREKAGDFFEGDILAAVVEATPDAGTLFVSNSMPVRDLDAFGGGRAQATPCHG